MPRFSNLKLVQLFFNMVWILESVLSQEVNNHLNTRSSDGGVGSSYFFYQQPQYPRDCTEARNQCSTSDQSGVYLIKPDGYPEPFEVYCDNTEGSGGWTVISCLQDGSVLFDRTWTDYKIGFGFLSQEFWIGNEKLSFLTNQNTYELRIDVTSTDGISFYVTYNKFRLSDEYGEYKLTSVGAYNGTEDEINQFLCPPNNEGDVYTSPDCSKQCNCISGHFECDKEYRCSSNAVCEERNNVSQCYCNEGYVGDGVNCTIDIRPIDCKEVYDRVSTESGVYKIKPTTWQGDSFDVYCNMADGGGWTVFQRRVNGSQDFYLYWADYEDGFGTANHELWLGNDKLHSLTSQGNYELRVDMLDSLGNPYYAKYSSFGISDSSDNFRLSLGTYSGTAGDSMSSNNGQAFTTRDRDNDRWSSNCATEFPIACSDHNYYQNGAWWYNDCGDSSLNCPYGSGTFWWAALPGGNPKNCNIKYSEMKVRPI